MPDYRRHRVRGGTYFFTVNLLERRLDTLCAISMHRFHLWSTKTIKDHQVEMRDFKLQSLGKTPDFERTGNNFREILKLALPMPL